MTERTSTLVLVRHGQSQWNLENKFTGWVDVPLTSKGEDEARSAGKKLKGKIPAINKAYTSALVRAQKTLDLILQEMGESPPIERSEKLNERHYGDLQGKNKDELRRQYGEEQVHIWRRSYDVPPPNGESLKDCSQRTLPYFQGTVLPALNKNACVLVVAHGNSLRSIVMALENLTPAQILELNLDTGVPLIYKGTVEKNQFRVVSKEVLK